MFQADPGLGPVLQQYDAKCYSRSGGVAACDSSIVTDSSD